MGIVVSFVPGRVRSEASTGRPRETHRRSGPRPPRGRPGLHGRPAAPEKFLALEIGDAHVIRNAGGRASDDALPSLIISCQLLGTKEVMVIHHTDCGMLTFTNDDLRAKLAAAGDASGIVFLPFSDNEASVRDDVDGIRRSPFIPDGIPVSGYIYEVETGKRRTVVPAPG